MLKTADGIPYFDAKSSPPTGEVNDGETTANPVWMKAAVTYNAAADHFDDAPLGFWERHGRRAVELASLQPSDRVLDVGCGTGASALPAAEQVAPMGEVIGIDVAAAMLGCARDKAAAQGLDNVTFRLADMSEPGELEQSFDAVISVFSVFFVSDMERQTATLWRMLRPGGRLVVTVWGQRAFEPGASIFGEEVRRVRPDMPTAPRPWERLTVPDGLRTLFADSGVPEPDIYPAPDRQPLASPADWWTIALGSGFRWEIEQLNTAERQTVKTRVIQRLVEKGDDAVVANALHAVARKPA